MRDTFRYKLHKRSPALGSLIRNVERYGFFYKDQRKYKLISATKEDDHINLEVRAL